MSAFELFYLIGLPLLILAASIVARTVITKPKRFLPPVERPKPELVMTQVDVREFVLPRAANE